MSEVLVPAAEAGVDAAAQAFNPRQAFRSVAVSIIVNGVLPFAIYKVLVPYFPNGSIVPLLYASAFPLIGLSVGFIRTRSIDAIAVFALFGIVYSVASTVIAGQVRLALILGATQGFLIAAAFFLSAAIGKPIIFFIIRQFVAGNNPQARARFETVNDADGGRTCFFATIVWGFGITLLACVGLTLAVTLPPATYLLVNNIVNTGVNIVLVIWTIRFVRPRLTRVAESFAAA